MSLKSLAQEAIERNRQRNQCATGSQTSATGNATSSPQGPNWRGSQSCVFETPRQCNCATGEAEAQPAAQLLRNHIAKDVVELLEHLARTWRCPDGELEELKALHRAGKLPLEYIEVLISNAPFE
jgi:hypothetical protein